MPIVSHPDDEPQLITLGLDEGRPGRVNLPPRAEVELRGRFGPHIAFDMRVVPVNLADYLGSPPRLTLVRAFLSRRRNPTTARCAASPGVAGCRPARILRTDRRWGHDPGQKWVRQQLVEQVARTG